MSTRPYDVIVFGATGFTGKLAAEYLHAAVSEAKRDGDYPRLSPRGRERHHAVAYRAGALKDLRWAVAGRDRAKLEAIQRALSGPAMPSVVVATSSDQASVDAMVKSTRVIVSFAGPFAQYGTPVVDACVRFGTDYADSTGETPWVADMIAKYHAKAEASKALIVPMCGFDSVPFDLGVFYACAKLRERGSTNIVRATSLCTMVGGFSGGSLASGLAMDHDARAAQQKNNPFALGGGPKSDAHLKASAARTKVEYLDEFKAWTAPFMMADLNTRVVRKSADVLAYRTDGDGFVYTELAMAPSEAVAKKLLKAAQPSPPEVRQSLIASGALPKPGEGPAPAAREKFYFQTVVKAVDDKGRSAMVSITGGDAGYEDTAMMVVEAGLCMALDRDGLPRAGGVLTPAAALGSDLVERLDRAGIRFKAVGDLRMRSAL